MVHTTNLSRQTVESVFFSKIHARQGCVWYLVSKVSKQTAIAEKKTNDRKHYKSNRIQGKEWKAKDKVKFRNKIPPLLKMKTSLTGLSAQK